MVDWYRYPDPVDEKRNYTYMQVGHAYFGIYIIILLFT